MIGSSHFEAWFEANTTAIEILDQWEVLDANELSPIVGKLRRQLDGFLEAFPGEWPRKERLLAHVGALAQNLSAGHKAKCRSDVRDLLLADLPELFKYLLTKAGPL
ncbi:hypothetical protein [Pseudomonas sp. AK106]